VNRERNSSDLDIRGMIPIDCAGSGGRPDADRLHDLRLVGRPPQTHDAETGLQEVPDRGGVSRGDDNDKIPSIDETPRQATTADNVDHRRPEWRGEDDVRTAFSQE